MRYRTFLVTGVEVLHLGGQRWQSNAWPAEHWRKYKGRWRLFTPAIDEYVARELKALQFGPTVDGLVVALEVADFASWPSRTFTRPETVPSYKPKYKDLWCYAKLNWLDVQSLTLKQQYSAYAKAVLAAISRLASAKRKPRDFDVAGLQTKLTEIFAQGKASTFTRAKSNATGDA